MDKVIHPDPIFLPESDDRIVEIKTNKQMNKQKTPEDSTDKPLELISEFIKISD